MRRLLIALTLLAVPAFAQTNGWDEVSTGWGEIQLFPQNLASGDVTSVAVTASSPLTGSATCTSGACAFTLGLGTVPTTKGGTNITTYTLGDVLYSSASNTLAKLAGNTTTTKKFLMQVGDGVNSAAPSWTATAADFPTLNQNTTGAAAKLNTGADLASNAACTAGTVTYSATFVYICIATGNVARAALTTGY